MAKGKCEVLALVEGTWLLLCFKLMNKGLARYEELHKRCLGEGMSLLEYADSL